MFIVIGKNLKYSSQQGTSFLWHAVNSTLNPCACHQNHRSDASMVVMTALVGISALSITRKPDIENARDPVDRFCFFSVTNVLQRDATRQKCTHHAVV